MKTIKITKLENKLLNEIMLGECDGVGMGYGEYDGVDISNEEKGVLGSLIKKGLVYDSKENEINEWDYEPMYCTYLEGKKVIGLEVVKDIYDPCNVLETTLTKQ